MLRIHEVKNFSSVENDMSLLLLSAVKFLSYRRKKTAG